MLPCILSFFVEYHSTLPLQHMFVKKLIHLLIQIHQIILKLAISHHFNTLKNIEVIV
jgi:hypothetical protein